MGSRQKLRFICKCLKLYPWQIQEGRHHCRIRGVGRWRPCRRSELTQLTDNCSWPLYFGSPLSDQIRSVAQLCPTLGDPMNRSTPGLSVPHQLPEFTQTHVHRVSDAIQPSHPLSSPSPPAPNPSEHQSLFQRVNSSHEVAKVLEFQLQHHSFQRNPRADFLQNGLVGSPCSPRDSQKSSPTPQFKSINSSALSLLHSPTLTSIHDHRKNHSLDQTNLCWQSKECLCF